MAIYESSSQQGGRLLLLLLSSRSNRKNCTFSPLLGLSVLCLGWLCFRFQLSPVLLQKQFQRRSEDDAVVSITKSVSHCCRRLVQSAFSRMYQEPKDMELVQHSARCQCGNVQLQVVAPKTLFVSKDDDSVVSYPKFKVEPQCLTVSTETALNCHQGRSFCSNCGTHLFCRDETHFYVNVHCLTSTIHETRPWTRHSVVPLPRTLAPIEAIASRHFAQSPPLPPASDEDETSSGELVEHKQDVPVFTVTAASSISKQSFGTSDEDFGGTESPTSQDLEVAAYRLRKALSPSTTLVVGQTDHDDDNESSSDDEHVHTFAVVNKTADDVAGDLMGATTDDPGEEPDMASASFESQEEQLRKFLRKHVVTDEHQL